MTEPEGIDPLVRRVEAWGREVGQQDAVAALIESGLLADTPFVARCVVVLRGDPPAAVVNWAKAAVYLARQSRTGDPQAMAALRSAIDLAMAPGAGGSARR